MNNYITKVRILEQWIRVIKMDTNTPKDFIIVDYLIITDYIIYYKFSLIDRSAS